MNAAGNLRRQFDLSSRDSLRDVTLESLSSAIQSYQSSNHSNNQASNHQRDIGLDVNLIDIIVDYAYPDAQPFRLVEFDMDSESIDRSSLNRTFYSTNHLIDHVLALRQELIDELSVLRKADVSVTDARVSSQYRPAQVAYGYDHRGMIAAQHPDWAGFEIESEIWRQWQAVDDSVRALYHAGARRERVTYEIQVEVTAAAKGCEEHRSHWLDQLIDSLQNIDIDRSSSDSITSLLIHTARAQLTLFHAFIPVDRPFPVIVACIEGADFATWFPRSRSSSPIDSRSPTNSFLSEWRAADSSEVLLLITTRTGGFDLVSFQSERSANQWLKLHNAEIVRADLGAVNEETIQSGVPDMHAYQTINQTLPYILHAAWTRAQRHM